MPLPRKYYRLFVLLLIVLLSGCATEANYRKMLMSWHGKNINALIDAWGYPDSTIKAPNGNKVYVYTHRDSYTTPGYSSGGYTSVSTNSSGQTVVLQEPLIQHPGQTYHNRCKTWFEYNKHDIIVRITYRGNACAL